MIPGSHLVDLSSTAPASPELSKSVNFKGKAPWLTHCWKVHRAHPLGTEAAVRPSSPKASVGSAAPDGLGVPPPGRSATELPPPWAPTLEEVGGLVEFSTWIPKPSMDMCNKPQSPQIPSREKFGTCCGKKSSFLDTPP